jgi:predicted HAD superfamily Cof-like phosphohydrolase
MERQEFPEAASLNRVGEFHDFFQHPVLSTPRIPGHDRCQLRVNLLYEELQELTRALEQGDLVEAADALCDLQYVLSGAIHELGLGPVFAELFAEVHDSNMSKACDTPELAQQTADYYLQSRGESCIIEQVGHLYMVYRESDHKTMKSIAYRPADLRGILNKFNPPGV